MTKNYRKVLVAVLVILAIGSVAFAQRPSVNDLSPANRTVEERQRDAGTKPVELYTFFGIARGQTVADLMPGGGYNTYILTNTVGPNGKVYSGPDRRDRMATRLATSPLDNVEIIGGFEDLPAGELDVIITVRNMHDLINAGAEAQVLPIWLNALKPGGILGVVDARTDKPGFDGNTHRINEQTVIDAVTAAGFELVESSDLLANPNDDYDSRSETGNRYDIDRMVLKFRKPGM